MLEKLTRDQEHALKEAGSREREHRQDWEVARAEVIALRSTHEELRDERDEIRREFDELVAIHRRAEHEVRRSREELRIATRRANERTREYEVRVEEIRHLRERLEEAQRTLHASEEEVFRLKNSQTSARVLSTEGHVLGELERERSNLRERLKQRQVELQELDHQALARRLEMAGLRLREEQREREESRLRIELERLRDVIRRGQPRGTPDGSHGDHGHGGEVRGGDAADERGEGSTEESARDRDEGGNDEFTPEWDSISPGESPTSWKMAIRAIEERDERFEKAVADLDQAQSTILRQEEELTRLMQSRVEMESELERRRAREETLAKLLEDGDEKVAVGVTENASDEEDRPVQVGDDGFPRRLARRGSQAAS